MAGTVARTRETTMTSQLAAKNLAEAAHKLLDSSESHDTRYHSILTSSQRMKELEEALDAYDERVAFEAGKPAVEPPEECGHGLFECCVECFVDDGNIGDAPGGH